MADYGLPDPVLSYIQGAPVSDVAQPVAPPPMDPTGLHPAILSYLTGQPLGMADGSVHPNLAFQAAPQGDIYMGGPRGSDDSGTQAPPPPPPPPPPSGGSTKGPMKHMIGPSPIIAGVAGGPDAAPEIADAPVASVTGGNLPTEPTSLTPPPQQPDIPTTIAMPTPTQDAAVKKQVAAQDAFAASPEGLQQKADAMDQASIQKQQQANQMDAAAQEATNTATANALQAHVQREAQQAQADAQRQAAYQADVDKYTQQYAQQVQDAANYHVNDDRSVGTGGLIAIALSGIGNALDHIHGPNAAAQIIQNGIQQRIADQWRQKDALEKKATGTAAVLNQFRQNALDDRQAQALQTAAELQKTSDQLKLVAAQSANPQVQANAVKTSAVLDQNSAALVRGEGVRAAQAKQDAETQAYRNADLGLRAQAHKDQVDYQNKMLDLKRDQIDAANKAGRAAAEQKAEQGGMVYTTGKNIVVQNPDGTTSLKAVKDYMRQPEGSIWVPGDEAAKELKPYQVHANTDKLVSAIDALRKLRIESGGDYTNYSEDANKKIAELQRATMALMESYGGSASPRSPEIIKTLQKQLTGSGDATSKIRAVEPILEQARNDATEDANATYVAAGYRGDPISYPDTVRLPDPPKSELEQGVQDAIKYQYPAYDPNDPQMYTTGQASADTINNAEAPIKNTIDTLGQQIADSNGTPSSRTNAANLLNQIIQKAANSDIREYAMHSMLAAKARAPSDRPEQPQPLVGHYTANRLP